MDNKSFAKNFQKRGPTHNATCTLQDVRTFVTFEGNFLEKGETLMPLWRTTPNHV